MNASELCQNPFDQIVVCEDDDIDGNGAVSRRPSGLMKHARRMKAAAPEWGGLQ
jgi:hypothetical protein